MRRAHQGASLGELMKKIILGIVACTGITLLAGCASEQPATSSTTTTEETTVAPAQPPTTTTTTVQQ